MSSTLADKMVVRYVGEAEVTPAERKEARENIKKAVKELYPHLQFDISTP